MVGIAALGLVTVIGVAASNVGRERRGAADPSLPTFSVAASEPAGSEGASENPSPTGAAPKIVSLDEGDSVDLQPGRYRLEEFRPPTEFEVFEPGWVAYEDLPDGFTIELDRVGLITGGIVQVVFEGPCFESGTRTIAGEPKDLIDWLVEHPYLETSPPLSVNLGTWTGLKVDVSQSDPGAKHCEPPPELAHLPSVQERRQTSVYLFYFGDNTYWVGAHERARVMTVDVAGQTVTMIAAAEQSSEFDAFLERGQRVLDSFRFAAGDP